MYEHIVNTDEVTTDYVEKADDIESEDSKEDNIMIYISVGIIAIVIIVALILIFLFTSKKKPIEEPEDLEREQMFEE